MIAENAPTWGKETDIQIQKAKENPKQDESKQVYTKTLNGKN